MAKSNKNESGKNAANGEYISEQEQTAALVDALKKAMQEQQVAPEVQEEALRTISEAAKGAATVDAAQLDAIARSAEARASVVAEALRHAESAEERQYILSEFLKADERDAGERQAGAERSTDTQRGIAKIGGKLLIGTAAIATAGLMVSGAVYANSKGWIEWNEK